MFILISATALAAADPLDGFKGHPWGTTLDVITAKEPLTLVANLDNGMSRYTSQLDNDKTGLSFYEFENNKLVAGVIVLRDLNTLKASHDFLTQVYGTPQKDDNTLLWAYKSTFIVSKEDKDHSVVFMSVEYARK